MCADGNQDSWWSTTLSLYIYHLISYMNKFCNRLSVNFISVSCISRRQLFILVRNKSVVLLLWIISFMVTLRLWIVILILISMIVVWSFIKHYNAKIYPNLIMTLPFKSWLVLMKSLDTWSLDTCKPCLFRKKMTETLYSGKTEYELIVEYHT